MIPEWLDPEIWSDWNTYRAEDNKKGRWTERAQRAFLRDCVRYYADGLDVHAMINEAMQKNWLTIYPNDRHRRKARPASHGHGPVLEIVGVDREKGRAAVAEALRRVK